VTVYIALLRGINVGGSGKLPMSDLRQICSDCGFGAVQTYIQSGNVIFTADKLDPTTAAQTLRSAISRALPLDPAVTVRTRDELADIVAANPFLPGAEPTHLHVAYFDQPAELPDDLDRYRPEEAVGRGREVYFHLPNGLGRSKLATDLSRRRDIKAGTMRNWRTTTTLLRMADDIA
jgi:uncharacterized protein (DUF1697 family)